MTEAGTDHASLLDTVWLGVLCLCTSASPKFWDRDNETGLRKEMRSRKLVIATSGRAAAEKELHLFFKGGGRPD